MLNSGMLIQLLKLINKHDHPEFKTQNLKFIIKKVPSRDFIFWSGKRDSNPRPRPWQGRALPAELLPQYVKKGVQK